MHKQKLLFNFLLNKIKAPIKDLLGQINPVFKFISI